VFSFAVNFKLALEVKLLIPLAIAKSCVALKIVFRAKKTSAFHRDICPRLDIGDESPLVSGRPGI
jgi:hypothetical protein